MLHNILYYSHNLFVLCSEPLIGLLESNVAGFDNKTLYFLIMYDHYKIQINCLEPMGIHLESMILLPTNPCSYGNLMQMWP